MSAAERLFGRLRVAIHRRLWGGDIHPSAIVHRTAYLDRTWPKGLHIEAGCRIGPDAIVLSHDMTRGLFVDTRIGAGTVMESRSIVMPGVTVGRSCLIEAGAVVTKDVPDGHRASGNPAQFTPIE